MLPDVLKAWFRKTVEPLVKVIAKTGLTPNALTIVGFLLNIGVGAIVAMGYIRLGGVLILAAGLFDTLDGALARTMQRMTKFGALLDSSLDRFSEAALLLGLLIYYTQHQATVETVLVYAVVVGSIMVSYVRARAEGLGLKCEVGLFPRPERLMLLALGLIVSQVEVFGLTIDAPKIVLWVLAVFANITAAQRIFYIWQITSSDGGQGQAKAAPTNVPSEKKSSGGKHRPRPRWSE